MAHGQTVISGMIAGLSIGVGIRTLMRPLIGQFFPAFDSIVLVIVPVPFLVAAAIACYLPAHRAASVDPMVALRAPKAVERFKERIRDITRQAKGVGLETTMATLAPYMRGWRGYFGFCPNAGPVDPFDSLGSVTPSGCAVAALENPAPSTGDAASLGCAWQVGG